MSNDDTTRKDDKEFIVSCLQSFQPGNNADAAAEYILNGLVGYGDDEPEESRPQVVSPDENMQQLFKASCDAVAIQGNRINKAVAYLTGLSMFGTATFQKEIAEAIEILQGSDYFTQMQ